jgi:hypothetical protein
MEYSTLSMECVSFPDRSTEHPNLSQEPERAFLLRVSYIEIYNETLRDLLNFKKGSLRDDEKPAIHTAKVICFSSLPHLAKTSLRSDSGQSLC